MIGLGRLFWKLFLGFWLTLVAAGITVGTAVWLYQQQREPRVEPTLAAGPRAELLLQAAAATLRFGGETALRALVEEEATPAHGTLRLYAVDARDEDLLGRSVPTAALRLARERTATADSEGGEGPVGALEPEEASGARRRHARRGIRLVESAEGRGFLLFVAPMDVEDAPAAAGTQATAAAAIDANANAKMGAEADPTPASAVAPQARARAGGRPRSAMHRMSLDPFVGIAIGLLASLGFSALLAWYLTRPIRHLRHAFASVADGRLETRVAGLMGRRTDEIAALGHDFDRMAEQLQSLILAQRRLLHDVSHELRSPLARLHAAIGLARQNPARSAAMLERIEREAQRIDGLVGELLTLARLEAAAAAGAAEPVDLIEVLEAVVHDARFEARALGRDVRFTRATGTGGSASEAPAADFGQFLIEGRADWLQRSFENVIRNAVRHTAGGTTVEVRLRRTPDGAVAIDISDSGPGVPVDELESIFEPFNRGRQPPDDAGHGLGLAIARRALAAHGGSIAASNRESGGLQVTIAFPPTAMSPASPIGADASAGADSYADPSRYAAPDSHGAPRTAGMTPRGARSLAPEPRDL